MAISLKQFVDNVSQSGLLSADDVTECCDALPPDRSDDVQELAKLLVRERKLTKYQAQIIYQGKHKALKFGEYTVLDKLGEGGMGVVLRARHGRMEREVAIKVLPAKALKSETAVDRFYKEVRAAAKLIHPNIVTAFDASEHAGTHYLVLEFVDGKDLSEILKEHGPLPIAQAVECTIQAARGLEYAHSKGLVHRDIKPANLLLDKDGTVKILDLGLARLEQEHASRDDLTKSGQIMGTVDYMSPEQARDTKHADARSDIYSLGSTLYRLLTGTPLYDGDSIMNKMLSHAQDPIPDLRSARADVPERLDSTFRNMVAKESSERQQSMTEVIADLKAALAGDSPPARLVEEPSSDSALTAFFAGLNSTDKVATTTKQKTTAQVVDETIDLHRNDETTGDDIAVQPPSMPRKPEPTRPLRASKLQVGTKQLVWLTVGGGTLCAVVLVALIFVFVGGGPDSGEDRVEQDHSKSSDDRAESAFGFAAPATLSPNRWYDLVPLVSDVNARIGTWEQRPDGIAALPPVSNATIGVPVELSGGYILHVAFTRRSGEASVNIGFPVGERVCSVVLDHSHGASKLGEPNTQQGPSPANIRDPDHLQSGHRYQAVLHVLINERTADITFELDSEEHLRWVGDPSSLPTDSRTGKFSLGSFDGDTIFHAVHVKPFTPATADLPPGTEADELVISGHPHHAESEESLLFNGRDLTGWEPVGDVGLWSARDGTIVGSGDGTGWLSTTKEYADFVCDFEYRLPASGNSGVFIRAPRNGPLNGGEFIEVQLWDDSVDPGNGNYTGSVFNIAKLSPTSSRSPAGEWNKMRIQVRGSQITITVNETKIQDTDLTTATVPSPMAANAARSSGYLGLQCHRTQVEFRNLIVRSL